MDLMLNELSRVTKIEKVEKDEIRDSLNLRYEIDSVTAIFSRISVGIGLSRSISGRYLLKEFIADSLDKAARSAPTNP